MSFLITAQTSVASECLYRLQSPSGGKYWLETPRLLKSDFANHYLVPILAPLLKVPRLKLAVDRASLASESEPHQFFSELKRDLDVDYNVFPHSAAGQTRKSLPQTGPVVVVANHPLGFIDAILLGDFIVASQRQDFKILGNALLRRSVPESVRQHLIAVDLWDGVGVKEEQQRVMRESREHLLSGGVIGIFPSGAASLPSNTSVGNVILDDQWKTGVARMIQEIPNVQVVPVFFDGRNTKFFYGSSNFLGTLAKTFSQIGAAVKRQPLSPAKASEIEEKARSFARQALFAAAAVRRQGESFHVIVGDTISSEELNSIEVPSGRYSSEHRKAIAEHLRVSTYQMSHSLPQPEQNSAHLRQLFPLRY